MKHQLYIFTRLALAGVVVLTVTQGCYRRVVSVKGPASSQYSVYEPSVTEETSPSRTDKKEEKAKAEDEKSGKSWWPF
jgi:hypothetical protein